MNAIIARVQKDAERREAAKVYQMPLWPEAARALPNEIIRSALFSAIRARPTEALKSFPISSVQGYDITYTGMKLDQSHLDVFEAVMHYARGTHEGNKVQFTLREILGLLSRSKGKTDRVWLKETLQRLTATSVIVTRNGKQEFWGSLLPQGSYDDEKKRFTVEVSRPLAKMFDRGFTRVQMEQRVELRRKPLAQWLHLYYASHAAPYAVSVALLCELSGSKTKSLRHFRQNLRNALPELQKLGVIESWRIDPTSDLVHVYRSKERAALPASNAARRA